MKKLSILPLLVIVLLFISCDDKKTASNVADQVFTNGKVYTVNDTQPWAEAVAIKGNKIVFVGSDEEVKAYIGKNTETTDLNFL